MNFSYPLNFSQVSVSGVILLATFTSAELGLRQSLGI